MSNRNELAAKAILERLGEARIGILVQGVDKIDPVKVAAHSAKDVEGRLHVASVGYTHTPPSDAFEFATDIETAVDWRSMPDLARRILVFVHGEVPKLHSLGDLTKVTTRDLANALVSGAAKDLAENRPQERFWEALKGETSTFPLSMLEDFVKAVSDEKDNVDAIPQNLWRLGLLRDDEILQSNREPGERLHRNRDLLFEMGQLTEQSRRRISAVLAKATGDEQVDLRQAFRYLKEYFRTGSKDVLRELDVQTIEVLLKAGRPMPKIETPEKKKPEPEKPDVLVAPEPPPPDRPISGRQLDRMLADAFLSEDEDTQRGLKELADTLKERFDNDDWPSEAISVPSLQNGRNLAVNKPASRLREFVGYLCSADKWGGVVHASSESLKDVVAKTTPADAEAFDPGDPSQGAAGQCLFSLLRSFDDDFPGEVTFSACLDRLIEARRVLAGQLDLLLYYPFLLFGAYPEVRQALDAYLESYTGLLHHLCAKEATLRQTASKATQFVTTELLRLDVIHVKTPSEWKAILSPLHPFHLWRFRELLNSLNLGDKPLTEEEKKQLASVLPDLPHVLHFLVLSPDITKREDVILPHAGAIEVLPTYENHTNRYLGSDGVEFIDKLLRDFLLRSPYSRAQVRLGLVDVPDLAGSLHAVAQVLEGLPDASIVVDAYFTRGQTPSAEVARLDFEEQDHVLTELMKAGRLVLYLHSHRSMSSAAAAMQARPVHVAYLFDQSQYSIQHAPKARRLLVSPLVVTYDYNFDEKFKKGTIAPSSEAAEGLFSDYHLLVDLVTRMPAGRHLRLEFDPGADLGPVNSLLETKATRWLALADRLLTSYAPGGAVPLGEQPCGNREVGVWAGSRSRVVRQFVDLLRGYNLKPDQETVASLLKSFGHIAAGGLLSVPMGQGGNAAARDKKEKGFLGTVLAAAWYAKQYPGCLIASLDTGLARTWLRDRPDSEERADLVGIRIAEDGKTIIVESIEVKTRAADAEARGITDPTTGERRLTGKAASQLQATVKILESIFGGEDLQPIFTPARREVLKYQVYRECFREIHSPEWQGDWFKRLKEAFATPATSAASVECHGVILHVHLEGNEDKIVMKDDVEPLSLVRLGAKAIQRLVGQPPESGPSAPPPSPPPVAPSGGPGAGPIGSPGPAGSSGNSRMSASNRAPAEPKGKPTKSSAAEPPVQAQTKASEQATERPPAAEASDVADLGEVEELSRLFRRACQAFRIQIEEVDPARAIVGPTVWRFYVKLARGQKFDPLRDALEDIGREMSRSGLLVSPIPNSKEIALDIPRTNREIIPLERGLRQLTAIEKPEQMPLAIGVTPEGDDLIRDLGTMPHLLVGGTTGAGKTVFLYSLLTSLLTTHPDPATLRILLSTSKPEDFVYFEGLPHLETGDVISDADEAIALLGSLVEPTLEERGQILSQARCRDIIEYNTKNEPAMPPFVVIVDEFADLADQLGSNKAARNDFYKHIRRIAQLGRNRGIHLVICTQRPSADLVPMNIRNLMNARVALRVNDAIASNMILNETGAQQLQFHGDMLFKEHSTITRAQSYFADGETVERIVESLKRS